MIVARRMSLEMRRGKDPARAVAPDRFGSFLQYPLWWILSGLNLSLWGSGFSFG